MGSCFSRRKKSDVAAVHSGSPGRDAKFVAKKQQQASALPVFTDSSTLAQRLAPKEEKEGSHGRGDGVALLHIAAISLDSAESAPPACSRHERICSLASVSPPLAQKQQQEEEQQEIILCGEDDIVMGGEEGTARSSKGTTPLKRARSEEEPAAHTEAKRRSFKQEEDSDGDGSAEEEKARFLIHEGSDSSTASFVLDDLLQLNGSPHVQSSEGSRWIDMSLDQQLQQQEEEEQQQQGIDSLSADFFALKHRYLSSCAFAASPPFRTHEEAAAAAAASSCLLQQYGSSVPVLEDGAAHQREQKEEMESEEIPSSSSPQQQHRSSVPPLEQGIMRGFALEAQSLGSMVVGARYSLEDGAGDAAFFSRSQPIFEEEEEEDGSGSPPSSTSDESDTFEFTQAVVSENATPPRRIMAEHKRSTHIPTLEEEEDEEQQEEAEKMRRYRGGSRRSSWVSRSSDGDQQPAPNVDEGNRVVSPHRQHLKQQPTRKVSSSDGDQRQQDVFPSCDVDDGGRGFHHMMQKTKSKASETHSQQQPSPLGGGGEGERLSYLSMEEMMVVMEKEEVNEEMLLSFLSIAGGGQQSGSNTPPSCPPSDVASEASFEFKIRSTGSTPHSTPSTPMLSAGSTPKRITQLSPLMLTPEEIAEIWGVFELRQQQHQHHDNDQQHYIHHHR